MAKARDHWDAWAEKMADVQKCGLHKAAFDTIYDTLVTANTDALPWMAGLWAGLHGFGKMGEVRVGKGAPPIRELFPAFREGYVHGSRIQSACRELREYEDNADKEASDE